jgi:probable F420-dependent oxidoreductase, Rv1855c family
MTRIGLQIPNFTYPTSDQPLFERIAATAVAGEQSGFDTIFVMDHFFQLPLIGSPELEMFEAYTLLGALAARTTTARLGTLVTGVTYRNPSLLAKVVTALDVISNGRALLGIGAAWFDAEHAALGFDFPPVSERFERLEEALLICRGMFTQTQTTVTGTHYQVTDAWNSPAPVTPGGPPILVGGTGEKKTLRLAAQYADELNCNAAFVELEHKLDVLDRHLADLGRARSKIQVTCLATIIVGETHAAAADKLAGLLRTRGVDDPTPVLEDAELRAQLLPRLFFGDPEEVVEQVQALVGLGLDGVVVNMICDGHDPTAVTLAGQTLSRALG